MWKLQAKLGIHKWFWDGPNPENGGSDKAGITGRHTDPRQHNTSDKLYRQQVLQSNNFTPRVLIDRPGEQSVAQALDAAADYLVGCQLEDGYWGGDYGGPLFLLAGLAITCHVLEHDLGVAHKQALRRYLEEHQDGDGGWGIHTESESNMFGTCLNYAAYRILGADPSSERCIRARDFMKQYGGAVSCPSWGAFWLCLLGVYDYDGINPVTPEMWLLPYSLPLHPGRMWCHTRLVYLPMAYLYGNRIQHVTALSYQLREEMLVLPYDQVNWRAQRNNTSPADLYTPHSKVLDFAHWVLGGWERICPTSLRNRALDECYRHVVNEDEQSGFICIGPVNKFLNTLVRYHREPNTAVVAKHKERFLDYLWVAEDGMKVQGYNGSVLWDCSFGVQALLEAGMQTRHKQALSQAYHFLDNAQILRSVPKSAEYYRQEIYGSWGFSTAEQGWPTSDCTAEGMMGVLALHASKVTGPNGETVSDERLYRAVDRILEYQNADGGFSTYEATRGPHWLELFNPSEVFGNIMIDYSYPECTSSSCRALLQFQKVYPDYRKEDIDNTVKKALAYVTKQQRPEGSWYGSWGVCFTYATMFAVELFVEAGFDQTHPVMAKARDFLYNVQKDDGGWGEDFRSCSDHTYVQNTESQVVNTAWALLTLMALRADRKVIDRGVKFLLSQQQRDGDWPQGAISGVFNHNCAITYSWYRNAFPIWALGRYRELYLK